MAAAHNCRHCRQRARSVPGIEFLSRASPAAHREKLHLVTGGPALFRPSPAPCRGHTGAMVRYHATRFPLQRARQCPSAPEPCRSKVPNLRPPPGWRWSADAEGHRPFFCCITISHRSYGSIRRADFAHRTGRGTSFSQDFSQKCAASVSGVMQSSLNSWSYENGKKYVVGHMRTSFTCTPCG